MHLFACPSTSQDYAAMFAFTSPEPGCFSIAPAEVSDSNNLFVLVDDTFFQLVFPLSASQVHLIQKLCGFPQITEFQQSFPHGFQIALFPLDMLLSSAYKDRTISICRCANKHSLAGASSIHSLSRPCRTVSPIAIPQVCPYRILA